MIGRTLGPAPLSTSNLANFYYERPSEFLDLAVIPNRGESSGVTEMFTFLVAVFPNPDPADFPNQIMGAPTLSAINNVVIHADCTNSGTFTVDWGDGTTEAYASGTTTYHVYNYDDLPASTEFRGYRQAVLSGFPTSINDLFQEVKTDDDGPFVPSYTSESTRNGSNILDMDISSRNATSFDIGGNSRPHKMCERVGLWNTTSNKLTNGQNAIWSGMSSLQEIPHVPYMHVDTTETHAEAFRACYKLRYLPDDFADPDRYWFWNSDNFYLCFDQCYKLEYLPEGLFTGRGHITELASVRDYRYMFRYCYKLCYIPELPTRTTGTDIRVSSTFQDCHYLKVLPKNFRANRVTSTSSSGLYLMLYQTLRLESFGDWNILDMDSSAKQPRSLNTRGYMTSCGRETFQIVPWVGIDLDVVNSQADCGSHGVGAWRPRTGAQFFDPKYYEKGYIDLENITDLQDGFNGNYCIKEYPILRFSPNTMTNNNCLFRTMFGNRMLKNLTLSGFAVNETFGNGEYYQMFYQCYMLQSIKGLPFNAANDSGDYSGLFSNANNIGHFQFPGLSSDQTGFSQNISLRYQPHDHQSIENIFRYLKSGSFTITLTNNNYADEIPPAVEAIATDKGWTVTH